MPAVKVNEVSADPQGLRCSLWEQLPRVEIALAPVPLEAQPNEYIRTAWKDRRYGLLGWVRVAAACFGGRLSMCLEWPGSAEPCDEFPDGAAVFFPGFAGASPPITIGSPSEPVRLWLWRDQVALRGSSATARALLALGPGSFRPVDAPAGASAASDMLTAESADAGGMRRVVISGDERIAAAGRMGIVLWAGANEERAGLGSVTHEWVQLSGEGE